MRTLMTVAAVAAVGWLPPAIQAGAQDRPLYPLASPPGMIHTEDGWREPTVAAALEELEQDWGGGRTDRPDGPARAILRQTFGPRTSAELDAFADRLAAMVLDATLPEHVQHNAKLALMGAADPDESYYMGGTPSSYMGGTPYLRAFDLLVQVYESGYDEALFTIWLADSVRGPAYLQDVLERSERPPVCSRGPWLGSEDDEPECADWWNTVRRAPWCRAGGILYRDAVNEVLILSSAPPRPIDSAPIPDGLPEHAEDWYRRCGIGQATPPRQTPPVS